MNLRYLRLIIATLAFVVIEQACIPAKKFNDLQDKYYALQGEKLVKDSTIKAMTDDYRFCKTEYQKLYGEYLQLKEDSINIALAYQALKKNCDQINTELQSKLSDREKNYNSLIEDKQKTGAELMQKEIELERKRLELETKALEIAKKEKEIMEMGQKNSGLTQELQKQLDRARELEAKLEDQKKQSEALKESIKKALSGFSSNELTVENRNGKVYVSMSDKLLFKSGSTSVDPRGVEALGILAKVINTNPSIIVNVEGHTDNVPLKGTGLIKDNWDLSLMRASSVLHILTGQYAVNPEQVIASGRGEYFPVSPNTTTDGKAKNRRTEIILTPKIDQLLQLLEK
jgi:chemotaxis protein MotB